MPSISKYHAAEPRQTLSHLSSEAPQLSFGYGAGGAATARCSLDKAIAYIGGGGTLPQVHLCTWKRLLSTNEVRWHTKLHATQVFGPIETIWDDQITRHEKVFMPCMYVLMSAMHASPFATLQIKAKAHLLKLGSVLRIDSNVSNGIQSNTKLHAPQVSRPIRAIGDHESIGLKKIFMQ